MLVKVAFCSIEMALSQIEHRRLPGELP